MSLSRPLLAFAIVMVLAVGSTTAQASVLISIDKSAQRMSVSVDGTERWSWPVSTGAGGYATPAGSYKPFRMEATHFSKEWDDAPMPHSIFFTKAGHAIHGTYDAAHLGAAVSHGCVRISAANATELFKLVKAEGMANTQVVISGQQPYGEPQAHNQNGQGFFGQSNYNQSTKTSTGRTPPAKTGSARVHMTRHRTGRIRRASRKMRSATPVPMIIMRIGSSSTREIEWPARS
jgi:hypothetical protein